MSTSRAKCCAYVTLFLLLLLFGFCSAGRRTGSSSRRSSSSYGRSSRVATQNYARPTSSYRHVQSYTSAPNYATPRRSAQATTPRYVIRTQPTARYNQPSYNTPSYSQPGYHKPSYSQPNYNQPGYKPGYNQPGYNQPGYHSPGYNQPGYNQPGYHPSYSQPSYGFPGSGTNHYQPGYGYRKDHGTRNAVFAGLGGSLLGAYLGYQIGSWSSGSNNNNNVGSGGGGGAGGTGATGGPGSPDDIPRYSVVHYYYTGDRPIPQNVSVQSNAIGKCDNTTSFCAPNSSPLCLANGTVYCITPLDSTAPCADNTTTASACVNSTIKIPCIDVNGTACNTTSMNLTTIQIPCISNISIFGSFDTNKLSVQRLSKRDVNETDTNISVQGISTKFCVTVIADPVPKPVALTNEQFIQYVSDNPDVKQEVNIKAENILKTFLSNVFA